jgi:hypothetical protein
LSSRRLFLLPAGVAAYGLAFVFGIFSLQTVAYMGQAPPAW